MTNQEKMKEAVKLLREVLDSWDDEMVEEYSVLLPSFDVLVTELEIVRFNN